MAISTYRKKLIEVALPLAAINQASVREKSIRHGHPSTLHLWWSRKPLAVARAVLFAQLVDDPSAWPDLFPTEEAQEKERERLFDLIRGFVSWEATNDPLSFDAARLEIARNWARSHPSDKAARILGECTADAVNDYLRTEVPPIHDPFAGGGTIPLEAQRLGLRAIATDLNPVAVLMNKALIELPPIFAGQAPVNPDSRQRLDRHTRWKNAEGLAEDIRYYGAWMCDQARRLVGHLYPDVTIEQEMAKERPELKEFEGKKRTVIAWLWARTVASPNPALGGIHVPLVSTFWLSTKEARPTWIEPVVESSGRSYRFAIRTGQPQDAIAVSAGTKLKGASFRCILSGTPIEPEYIRNEGRAGRLGMRLMAIAVEGPRGRIYLEPTSLQEEIAQSARPRWAPEELLPEKALGFRVQNYGLTRWRDLYTSRQTTVLTTLCDLVKEVRARVLQDALSSHTVAPELEKGRDASKYADAIACYMALGVARYSNASSSLCTWNPGEKKEDIRFTFALHALPMSWSFAEGNPFSDSSGNFSDNLQTWIAKAVACLPASCPGIASQRDAMTSDSNSIRTIISSDPPYFDNIPYADLSDYFYIWLRRSLKETLPELLSTIAVPKEQELVADPFRHGGKQGAEDFFVAGMTRAMSEILKSSEPSVPVSLYYAFKQAETDADLATASTGWEKFLQALIEAEFVITGTWPVRSERTGRTRELGSNALASSVVLVARKRAASATSITRSDFRRQLRLELPTAISALQQTGIAPVDIAQASIGPGMAIFSRHVRVVEADGQPMTVRTALQLINEALDECLSAQEGEMDADTRFAVTWFETHCWSAGSFGDAETLAKARNISVAGIVESGILHSAAGKVRLLKRSELPPGWDPRQDTRVPVWEATQHLIHRLEEQGEPGAAALHHHLGPLADHAQELAYRLYSICERKGWAEDARAYNGLVTAWPEIARLAAAVAEAAPTPPGQIGLGLVGADPPAARKKRVPPRKSRKST